MNRAIRARLSVRRLLILTAIAALSGCASVSDPPPPPDEPMEIAFLALNRNGDTRTHFGFETGRPSVYLLLYNDAWMNTRRYGGPLEAFARKHGIPVIWRKLDPGLSRQLADLLRRRGFRGLPGSADIDCSRLEAAGVSEKVLVVTGGDVRHAVSFDEATARNGPEGNAYRDCEDAVLDAFNNSREPPLQVPRDPPPSGK